MAELVGLASVIGAMVQQPSRPVARANGEAIDGARFVERVAAWRETFVAATGRTYALFFNDGLEFAAALFGAWHAGKTVVLPGDRLPASLQALQLRTDGFAGDMTGALKAAVSLSHAVGTWQELPAHTKLILHTSGSSGDPVEVPKQLFQFDNEIAALEAVFGESLGDAVIHATVSHQHIYGLLFRILWPLASGRRFEGAQLHYPEQLAKIAADEPACLVASPAMLTRIPPDSDWSRPRSALRMIFSSGGPLPEATSAWLESAWGVAATQVFGSTETGGIAWRQAAPSSWTPLPGVCINTEGGILTVQSPHLANAHWFTTQDQARSAGTGFELLGRADRLVKLGDRRVSLSGIERLLEDSDLVIACRALVAPGHRDRVCVVAVLSVQGTQWLAHEGRGSLLDRLASLLKPAVDAIALPRQWRFVASLPANAQGKITLQALAALFEPKDPVPAWTHRDPLQARLSLCVSADLPIFNGHFPRSPVVPGVAMLDWAIRWGIDAFAIDGAFRRMEGLKFQQLVVPDTQLGLELGWNPETAVLKFCYQSETGVHAQGRIVFGQAELAT